MSDLVSATRFAFNEYAVAYKAMTNPMWEKSNRYYRDRIKQYLANNLWGNNPGELDRWADDGGHVP